MRDWKFWLCLALKSIEQWAFVSLQNILWYGTSAFKVIFRNCDIYTCSRAFGCLSVTTSVATGPQARVFRMQEVSIRITCRNFKILLYISCIADKVWNPRLLSSNIKVSTTCTFIVFIESIIILHCIQK